MTLKYKYKQRGLFHCTPYALYQLWYWMGNSYSTLRHAPKKIKLVNDTSTQRFILLHAKRLEGKFAGKTGENSSVKSNFPFLSYTAPNSNGALRRALCSYFTADETSKWKISLSLERSFVQHTDQSGCVSFAKQKISKSFLALNLSNGRRFSRTISYESMGLFVNNWLSTTEWL